MKCRAERIISLPFFPNRGSNDRDTAGGQCCSRDWPQTVLLPTTGHGPEWFSDRLTGRLPVSQATRHGQAPPRRFRTSSRHADLLPQAAVKVVEVVTTRLARAAVARRRRTADGSRRLPSCCHRSGPVLVIRASDGNGDFSLCSAIFQVAYSLGDLGKRIRLAHYGSDVTGLDLLTQRFEVSLAVRRDDMVSRWGTTGESMSARICRPTPVHLPPSPPAMTSVPSGVSARRSRDRRLSPPVSRIRS